MTARSAGRPGAIEHDATTVAPTCRAFVSVAASVGVPVAPAASAAATSRRKHLRGKAFLPSPWLTAFPLSSVTVKGGELLKQMEVDGI